LNCTLLGPNTTVLQISITCNREILFLESLSHKTVRRNKLGYPGPRVFVSRLVFAASRKEEKSMKISGTRAKLVSQIFLIW